MKQFRRLPGRHETDVAEHDSYYRKTQLKRKKTNRWCKGKEGMEHDYQPHNPYPWVKNGEADYGSLSLPWKMSFRKCSTCGKTKIISTKNKAFDPVKREEDWEFIKMMTGFEEVEPEIGETL